MVWLALVAAAPAAAQTEPDIFIGTLAVERGEVVLNRCDLAGTRYVLHDDADSQLIAGYRADPLPGYAEVIGRYREEDGRPALMVSGFAARIPGRSCHLSDLVAAAETNMNAGAGQSAPVAPAKAVVDPAGLAGHYYLSGVMETGSELLLRPDGSFEWYLSYGAMDQTAQGKWRVEGDAVVLATAPVRTDKPLFAYLQTGPWSAEAGEEYRRRKWAQAEAAVRARCPFLPELEVPTTPLPMIDAETSLPAAVLREQAAAALQAAIAARTRVEVLARDAPSGSGEAVDRVLDAQDTWLVAREAAFEAARKAGLPKPSLRDPVLPQICTLPEAPEASSQTAAGRLGVQVTDHASQQPLRRVQIMLRFADGSVESLTTEGGGFAFVAGDASQAVSATLHIDGVPAREEALTFRPAGSGILHFSVDREQLARPAFTTLRLRVVGNALIPEDFAGGRYERQP